MTSISRQGSGDGKDSQDSADGRSPPASGAAQRILVVDDDRDFADTVVQLLQMDGFEVDIAHSIAAARQVLAMHPPQVALIDIRLGDGSGLDLATEIKAARSDISCVMMTAYASVDSAVSALQEGAHDYLRKPFYTRDLLSTINRCLERNALVRDRDRAEAALRERNLELETLNLRLESLVQSMQTVSGSDSIGQLCHALARQAVDLIAAARGSVTLRSRDGQTIESVEIVGGDRGRDRLGSRSAASTPAIAVGNTLDLPLLSADQRPIGSVNVQSADDRSLTIQDRELLEILASHASEAIHRLQALDRVSGSEARMRDIIDNSPSMISLQDPDGRFLIVNARFEEWFGVRGEVPVGRSPAAVLPGATADLFRDARAGDGSRHAERQRDVAADFADGTARTLSLTRFPVHAPDGRLLSVGTIATDVTEQRMAEEHLRRAHKMEALGQLTGGVAHDFNNLLAVIAGNLSLLKQETEGIGETAEVIEDAIDAAQAGADLTHRLLAFGRLQTLRPQRVDGRALLTKMSRVLTRALGETVDLVAEPADDLWPIRVDRSQLESCLLNLALNARDAMADGGELRITAENSDRGGSGTDGMGPGETGHNVLFTVSDSGTGMDDDVLSRAVQPFFTTKSSGEGSGLGLSMVDGFVEQSGGRLEISSTPGRGTTVRVYLPRCPEHTGDGASIDVPAPDRGGHGGRILVVEDQPKVRRLAGRILTRLGYEVLESGNAADALHILAGSADIDLLFTDIVLPGGMSGVELADEARRRRPGLKVLYTSGYAPESVLDKDRSDREAPLVRKPFQMEDLAKTVRHALDLPRRP